MTDPLLGRALDGRYRVERKLGQGGMGAVYEAIDTQLGRAVAVKTLLEVSDPRDAERFRTEALAAAALRHPNIVEVFDFAPPSEGRPAFLVMELLPGRSLSGLLAARGTLPVETAIHVALQMLDAVGAAHRARILHRDVKPSNIIVFDATDADRPRIKVVDFGIAKMMDDRSHHTTTGVLVGTPPYMAPEQLLGERASERTDLYSIGVCLYEMLAGSRPFVGTGGELASQILRGNAPALPLEPALVAVVQRGMHHAAEERFASAEDFAAALRTFGEPKHAAPAAPAVPAARRWPLFVGVAVATLVAGAIAIALLSTRARPSDSQAAVPPPVQAPPIAAVPPPPQSAAPVESASATTMEQAGGTEPPPARRAQGVLSICSYKGFDLCTQPVFHCECLDEEKFPLYDSNAAWGGKYAVTKYDLSSKDKPCSGFSHGIKEGKFIATPGTGRYSCAPRCDEQARREGARLAVPGTPCTGYIDENARPGTWRALK